MQLVKKLGEIEANLSWKEEALRNKRETIRLVIVCKNETVGLVALL
jgi:hypothetical protein